MREERPHRPPQSLLLPKKWGGGKKGVPLRYLRGGRPRSDTKERTCPIQKKNPQQSVVTKKGDTRQAQESESSGNGKRNRKKSQKKSKGGRKGLPP